MQKYSPNTELKLSTFNNNMKNLIIVSFLLISLPVIAQRIVVDPNISTRYENIFKKFPISFKKFLQENPDTSSRQQGFALLRVVDNTTDTLNKKEKIHYDGSVKIIDVPLSNNIEALNRKVNEEPKYIPIIISSILKKDGLVFSPFMSFNTNVSHKILKNLVYTRYEEYYKRDTILRSNPSSPKTNSLNVATKTILFKLNTLHFKPGDIIYGEVEFETAPYYIDNTEFTSGYIKLKQHFKYIFKSTITADRAL